MDKSVFACVDVEGSGMSPPELVQVGVVLLNQKFECVHEATWDIRPNNRITYWASRVHGLTREKLQNAPSLDNIGDEIVDLVSGKDVVAHHASGDVKLLKRSLPGLEITKVHDTLKLARDLFPDLASYSLDALCAELLGSDLPEANSFHNALDDARNCAALFRFLQKNISAPRQGELF